MNFDCNNGILRDILEEILKVLEEIKKLIEKDIKKQPSPTKVKRLFKNIVSLAQAKPSFKR